MAGSSEPTDPIEPNSIAHRVDDHRDLAEQAFYNYLVYAFERDGLTLTARAYIDQINSVTILTAMPPTDEAEAQLRADVAAYLARRYNKVTFLHEMSQ